MADTLKGRKFYVCETVQDADLDESGFEALTYVQVKHVGMIGETGTQTNLVSYDELDTEVTQKQKGISNAGDPPIEVSKKNTDPGQIAMRSAANTKNNYAFKVTDDDAPAGGSPTTYYMRGVVTGPTRPNGRNEDFNLEIYTLGLNQKEIIVYSAGAALPANTLIPSITSNDGVGTTDILSADVGSWTGDPSSYVYQWEQDTAGNGTFVAIGGATSANYTIVAGNDTNRIRVGVKGVNAAGTTVAFAYSLPVGPAENP